MILFFDTETTGLPDFNQRARHESQPHLVQLAAILTDDAGAVIDSVNVIVKPEGYTIPKEASDIHGITHERAMMEGVPEKDAAAKLLDLIKKASLIVAHNLQFDKFMARIAMRRHELFTDAEDAWWKELKCFCTMRATTDICKLPGMRGGYKWPKLSEVYRHAFKKELNGAHDALADVTACKDVYFWLIKREQEDAL